MKDRANNLANFSWASFFLHYEHRQAKTDELLHCLLMTPVAKESGEGERITKVPTFLGASASWRSIGEGGLV